VLDKNEIFNGRRILSISTASVVWVDTKLTYIAVIARGSPLVKVLCYKNNENKLILFYSLNMCPLLANPDSLETNPG